VEEKGRKGEREGRERKVEVSTPLPHLEILHMLLVSDIANLKKRHCYMSGS